MQKNRPRHIGIIPDGNRRWATAHGLSKAQGYEHGLEPGLRLLRHARRAGIEEVTYYGFTMDNCKRSAEQCEAFRKACVEAVRLLAKEGVDLLVIGKTDSKCFPKELIPYTTRTSLNGGGIRINMLVNYGWEWDISKIKTEGEAHSSDISRIDLIIRWGGMRRLSGFLPLQSVYSDFYVVDKYWPDYADEDFDEALAWYSKQDVTLGG